MKHGGGAAQVIRSLTDQVVALVKSTGLISIDVVSTDRYPGHQIFYQQSLDNMKSGSQNLDLDELLENEDHFEFSHMASCGHV